MSTKTKQTREEDTRSYCSLYFVLVISHPGISLLDPGDASLRRRRCRCRRPLPPLWPIAAAAATVVGCHQCRLRPLFPLVSAAAFDCRICQLPLAAPAVISGHCLRRPPSLPTTAAVAAATAFGCYRCHLRPPLVTAAIAVNCRLRQPPPSPPSAAPAVSAGLSCRCPP